MKYLLLLHCIIFTNSQNLLNFSFWEKDYRPQNCIISIDDVNAKFTYSVANPGVTDGCRMHSPVGLLEGTYCSSLSYVPTSGLVFTMYLSSGEPNPATRATDKWDELDFELPFYTASDGQVWVNVWHNGQPLTIDGNNMVTVPNSIDARYCVSWKTGGQAKFYADGVLLRSHNMYNWSKPLIPYASLWGYLPGDTGWQGNDLLTPNETIFGTMSNSFLADTQDLFTYSTVSSTPQRLIPTKPPVFTVTQSFLPTPRPTGQPTRKKSVPPTRFISGSGEISSSVPSSTTSNQASMQPSLTPSICPSSRPTLSPSMSTKQSVHLPPTKSPTENASDTTDAINFSNSAIIAGFTSLVLFFIVFLSFLSYYFWLRKRALKISSPTKFKMSSEKPELLITKSAIVQISEIYPQRSGDELSSPLRYRRGKEASTLFEVA